MECEKDFDCPGTTSCYVNVTWLPEGESLCACEGFFGWTGDDCQDLTTQGYVYISLVSVCLALALPVFMTNVRALWRLFHIPGQSRWGLNSATLIFTLIALLGIIVWRISTLTVILTPQYNTVTFPGSELRLHPVLLAEKFTLAVATVFSTLGMLNVSILWLEIARKSARMLYRNTDSIWGGYARSVYLFEFCFVCVLTFAVAKTSASLAALLSLPFIFIIICTFIFGAINMTKLIGFLDGSKPFLPHLSSSVGSKVSEDPETGSLPGDDAADVEECDAADDDNGKQDFENVAHTRIGTMTARVKDKVGAAPSLKRTRTRKNSLEKLTTTQRRERKDEYVELLEKIRRTGIQIILSLAGLFTATAIYSILGVVYGSRELCRPGSSHCVSAITSDLMAYFELFSVASVVFYMCRNVCALERRRDEANRGQGSGASRGKAMSPGFRQSAALQPMAPIEPPSEAPLTAPSHAAFSMSNPGHKDEA
ncbi:Hypothetical Protein FCC1311_050252 [Hondaea fermentalgiana]|uniref:Uncharacterized protein n=1 Tax=Hondaea fermentalgiana TaxID=2315210 RepID=A0A2R5GLP9_9STRA|nr:Hypothetical Protein FCC1311_050252 [Hondaea fermentalgiana]|eukprot:GBG28804.1 Hypothetical Protein FCC1311_050252 [Hondaea fermentalgiana]